MSSSQILRTSPEDEAPEPVPEMSVVQRKLYTMGSVRGTPSCKRGVPGGAPAFLVEANNMAKSGGLRHVHTTGDLSCVAVDVALKNSTHPEQAASKLYEVFDGRQGPGDFEIKLRPFTDERIRLARSMADLLELNIEVVSTLDFIRQRPEVARWILEKLQSVFRTSVLEHHMVDVKEMNLVTAGGRIPPDYEPRKCSMGDLAVSTLPSRFRRIPERDVKLAQSLYALTEGLFAAAVIASQEGNKYASYRGSEIAREGTIIENMKTVVRAVVWSILGDASLEREISSNFVISSLLDGIGLKMDDGGQQARSLACDPHTMDKKEENPPGSGILPLQKLPLLPYDEAKGGLRAATDEEIRSVLIDPGTCGISGSRQRLWFSILPALERYLSLHKDDKSVGSILRKSGVSSGALEDWIHKASLRLVTVRAEPDRQPNKIMNPIVPGNRIECAVGLIRQMAIDTLKIEEKMRPRTR